MNSRLAQDFLVCFAGLPDEVKGLARQSYRRWKENPSRPGVRFKRIHNQEAMYSVRIGRGWRALGLLDSDTITWFWIGSHAEYDQLIR